MFPLINLGLTQPELDALRWQGFIASQPRNGTTVYYLRFRLGRVQRSKYLGRDEKRIRAIRESLQQWQLPRRTDDQLRRLVGEGLERIREHQRRLTPLLATHGYRFDGRAIRQVRGSAPPTGANP